MNNNDNIKKDNKKAVPKYLIVLLVSAAVGFIAGLFSTFIGGSDWTNIIVTGIHSFLQIAVPYISVITLLLLILPAFIIYKKAKKLAEGWDGENEELPDDIDAKLNSVLLLISIAMLVTLFGLGSILTVNIGPGQTIFAFLSCIITFILITLMQQKAVDLTRKMNPEKQGSVYDTKFQKKWYGSCDEAEKQLIGEASYHAFSITTKTCMILWAVTIVTHIAFDTGLFPMFLVLLIGGISQISYILKAMKLSKAK